VATLRDLRPLHLAAVLASGLVLGACSHAPRMAAEPEGPELPEPAPGRSAAAPAPAPTHRLAQGKASFYAASFEGRMTANGELYSGDALTAAHRTLPFGTHVRVTNLRNHKSVEVVINDRGPHRAGRVIDLSRRAAEEIDLVRAGVSPVRLEIVDLAAGDLR
jgi:rare lipoprotein A